MKKKIVLAACLSLILPIIIWVYLFNPSESITTQVFKIENGFGYELIIEKKIIIKQENIPAIDKQMPFCSIEDAQKIADLVKQKILKKVTPTVSLVELKDLGIVFNCVNLQ